MPEVMLLLPDLVVVAPEGLDGALELVGDVELVCVEEEEDAVDALGEPLEHADEVVAAVRPLLLAGQYAGRVHDRNACIIRLVLDMDSSVSGYFSQ